MNKVDLLNQIENSKIQLRNHLNEIGFQKEELSTKIKNILEGEPSDIQLIMNLHYIDNCSTEEISEILGISETLVLNYFQLILFKIKLILDYDDKKEYPFSSENCCKKPVNRDDINIKWTILDLKT